MPCMTIARNAGVDGAVVVAKVESLGAEFGYDAMNGEYVNMIEKGIIDPTKVAITTVIRIVSSILCNLNVIVVLRLSERL